ncbi:tumor suppressor candidate 2 isoform X2 [Lampetra planeri]
MGGENSRLWRSSSRGPKRRSDGGVDAAPPNGTRKTQRCSPGGRGCSGCSTCRAEASQSPGRSVAQAGVRCSARPRLVLTRRSSMYFDEDGDLAHEFYEEKLVNSNGKRRAKLLRLCQNLIPQAERDPDMKDLGLHVFHIPPMEETTNTLLGKQGRAYERAFNASQVLPP